MGEVKSEMQEIMEVVLSLSEQHQADALQLLAILREMERVHQEIVDRYFLPALPNSRHGLFDLLLDIETNGGWPYIYRMKLWQLLAQLQSAE